MTTKAVPTKPAPITSDLIDLIAQDLIGHLTWAGSCCDRVKRLEALDPVAAHAVWLAVDHLIDECQLQARLVEEIPKWIAEERAWRAEQAKEVA